MAFTAVTARPDTAQPSDALPDEVLTFVAPELNATGYQRFVLRGPSEFEAGVLLYGHYGYRTSHCYITLLAQPPLLVAVTTATLSAYLLYAPHVYTSDMPEPCMREFGVSGTTPR